MWSAEHLVALAATAGGIAALVVLGRKRPGSWLRLLAVAIVADEAVWWATLIAGGGEPGQRAQPLPLQLCDFAILVAAFALWTRNQLAAEVTYFWALAGTLQGLLTPDLPQHFPNYLFFQYYIAHGGVIAAALVLVIGLRMYPRPLAVVRVAGLTIAYAAFVGLIDVVTGADYMYLRAKPATGSLLDLLGPWPVYILSASVVGVAFMAILDAPFRLKSRLERKAIGVRYARDGEAAGR
ncbi:MAG TPA: TIGR02206 family membrane protein [Candidatus Dormibacteraeota bacterium]|nr:TIGR02206 family membrane protein [Candidatus Dormibacteraeota bacterium]